MKKKNIFLLSWRRTWIAIIVGFLSVVFHNLIYALFRVEEPVFFFVPFLVVLYLVVAGVYTLIKRNK
ncbi:hypothetical protein HOD29_04240 [archaeon]|nr:hypothetical protein [archaeon]